MDKSRGFTKNLLMGNDALRIDPSPSVADLIPCWQALEADPLRAMLLADTTTFLSVRHFLAAVGSTIIPFVACADGEPAAIAWLYNVAMVPPKMTPISAFVAVYTLPAFRHQHVVTQCADEFLQVIKEYGVEHLWAEVRIDNLPSRQALLACGFQYLVVLPAWKRYQGVWHDMALYHLSF